MRIGVVSEGPADFAVVRNIIKGALGLDASEVDSIRPDLQVDETSRNSPGERAYSNWALVIQECCDQTSINNYLYNEVDGPRLVVIHIDTAECELPGFGVERPAKDRETYALDCCMSVVMALYEWTTGVDAALIVAAVAVEETDAWLISSYDATFAKKGIDSGSLSDPKNQLQKLLQKTNQFSENDRKKILREKSELKKYHELSGPLRKTKALREAMNHNHSLKIFAEALCQKAERLEPGLCRFSQKL